MTRVITTGPGVLIDLDRYRVTVNRKEVRLTRAEWVLLQQLAEAEGRMVTREAIALKCWGDESAYNNARTADHDRRVRVLDVVRRRAAPVVRGEAGGRGGAGVNRPAAERIAEICARAERRDPLASSLDRIFGMPQADRDVQDLLEVIDHVGEVLREAERNNGGYGFVRSLLEYLGR